MPGTLIQLMVCTFYTVLDGLIAQFHVGEVLLLLYHIRLLSFVLLDDIFCEVDIKASTGLFLLGMF